MHREPADRLLRIVFVAIAAVAILGALQWMRRPAPPAGSPEELALPLLDGGELELASLEGRVVLLDFWASWCAPCVESMPLLHRMAEQQPDVELVAVNVGEDEETIRRFLNRHGLEGLRVALDRGPPSRLFQVTGLPTLVVLDVTGGLHRRHLGGIDEEELAELLRDARRSPPAR